MCDKLVITRHTSPQGSVFPKTVNMLAQQVRGVAFRTAPFNHSRSVFPIDDDRYAGLLIWGGTGQRPFGRVVRSKVQGKTSEFRVSVGCSCILLVPEQSKEGFEEKL